MKLLAIIPARGGSKGIPRKNIKPLAGKPLIHWTIEAALRCSAIDRVIVSTDDREIADISVQAGASVPFLRPPELSTDTSKSLDPVLHLLDHVKSSDQYIPDSILLLQPTSPLRTSADIDAAIELQTQKDRDAVVSVCEVSHPVTWFRQLDADGKFISISDEELVTRRQDAGKLYQLNGALYLIKRNIILEEQTFLPKNTFAYIMPVENSIDIDTPWEFHLADLIMRDRLEAEKDKVTRP
jgi:CMP-N,N'-diacetyllegionaminic acid synthase